MTAPLTFPDGFLWGAATAAHQVEGNNVNNHYWEWEHAPHTPVRRAQRRRRRPLPPLARGPRPAGRRGPQRLPVQPGVEPDRAGGGRVLPRGAGPLPADGRRLPRPRPGAGRHAQPLHHAALVPQRRLVAQREGRRPVRPVHRDSSLPVVQDASYVITLNEPNLAAACRCSAGDGGPRRAGQRAAEARPGASPTPCSPPTGAAWRCCAAPAPRRSGWRWSARSGSPRTAPRSRWRAPRRLGGPVPGGGRRRRLRRHAGLQLRADRPDGPVAGRARSDDAGAHGVPAAGARRAVRRVARGAAGHADPDHRERHRDRRRRAAHRLHRGRCAACARRSPTAPTCAATCTGACSTTSSGSPATRRRSGWSPSTASNVRPHAQAQPDVVGRHRPRQRAAGNAIVSAELLCLGSPDLRPLPKNISRSPQWSTCPPRRSTWIRTPSNGCTAPSTR